MEQQDTPVHLTEEFAFGPLETRLNLALNAILLTLFITLVADVGSGDCGAAFKCHVGFSLFAFLVLQSQAILTVSDNNILTRKLNVNYRILLHWTFSVASVVFMLVGFICSFNADSSDFGSSHSLWGLATICIVVFSSMFGVWMRTLIPWLGTVDIRPEDWNLWHSVLGVVGYLVAFVAVCTGVFSHLDIGTAVFLIILLTMTTAHVLIKPIALVFKRAHEMLVN